MSEFKISNNANPYEFDLDDNGFPALTEKNFLFVKALIENDSNYRAPDDLSKNYKKLLENGFQKTYEEILLVVKLIDKYDSTHLSSEGRNFKSYNKGREITAEKIKDLIDNDNLEQKLLTGCTEPIHVIANAVNESHLNILGVKGGKYNISFASKYCAYVSKYALKEDNYCIYDRVLGEILPYYAKMYCNEDIKKITIKNQSDYNHYKTRIDEVICSAAEITGYKASYKQFDDLLWYYFKGERSRIRKAMECLNEEDGRR